MVVFKESLEKEEIQAPEGHPVNILMEEHKMLLSFAGELNRMAKKIKGVKDFDSIKEEWGHLEHIVKHFKESESHYLREENVLFPPDVTEIKKIKGEKQLL